MSARPSAEALWLAADWCENGYEGDPAEDPNVTALTEVAAWLRRESERAQVAAVQDRIKAETGVRPSAARVRRVLADTTRAPQAMAGATGDRDTGDDQ